MARKISGTLDAVETSDEVIGVGVAYRLTFAGTATVVLQYWDEVTAAWVTSRSHTASTTNNPNHITDAIRRRWRLNCTAHTDNVTFFLQAGRE